MKMWSCEDRTAPFVDVFRRTAIDAGYDLTLIAPGVPPPGFAELARHYVHMSPNPAGFELASFRRWFEIAARVAPGDRFVLADSDLVVQTRFADLPAALTDFDGLVASVGVEHGQPETGIVGGFSLWSGRLLHDFCAFMVAEYAGGTDRLAALYAAGRAQNPLASVSDMLLLYLWQRDCNVPFLDSNRLFADASGRQHYIDHNIFMADAHGARFAMSLGHKALRFETVGVRLRTVGGEPVIPAVLHLVGRGKLLAADIAARRPLGVAATSAYILAGRRARRAIAAVRR